MKPLPLFPTQVIGSLPRTQSVRALLFAGMEGRMKRREFELEGRNLSGHPLDGLFERLDAALLRVRLVVHGYPLQDCWSFRGGNTRSYQL